MLIIVSSLSIITFAQSDRDGDGFADDNDSCVNRGNEGGLGVDETGCPYYDADWDGVYDRDDLCPSRANEYGYGIDETGCPLTADNSLPQVTEEPLDSDGDGMLDSVDSCPWQGNEGGLGVDESGCPYYDADWDGFYDRDDACPTQGDEGGLGVDESGCPYYDADWDGFYDRDDLCPWQANEYGYGIDETGCPIEGTSDVTNEPTPEVTPEPTEPTPEITPEPTEPTPEITPEPTEPTPEITPEPTEPTPEVTPEPTEPTPEVTPEPTEPTPEVTPEPTEPPRDNHPGRDADGDGIPDDEDTCPWAGNEGGYGVDETGCPFYDTDGDGFLDRNDACPWQGDEGGIGVDETGCPLYDPEWDDVEDSNIEALDLDICWSSHPGSSVSQWRISNPDFPSVSVGRGTRVFFNWTVYDAPSGQGNIIDSGRAPFWDSPAVTQINTRYGQSLRIEWSIGRRGPILGVMVINADDTGRCDLPRVSLDGDGSGGIAPDYSTTYTEDQAPVDIQDDVNVSTPGNVTVSSATVTITNWLDGVDEILTVNVGASGLTAAYANGVLTITGDASPQTYQTVLDTLTYVNASQDPDETQRVVEVLIFSNTMNSASVFAFVDVIAVNDAPVAGDDVASTDEDTSVNIPVLDNDTDVDGDTLSVSQIISDPTNGVVVIEVDGTITYTPAADYNGADSFVYEISDGNGGTDTATVTITINPVNDAPIANDDSATTDEDTPVNISVLDNDSDIDGDTLSVSQIISDPTNGNVVIEADNTITYTPDADYNGADSFVYEVSDGNGGFDTATVTITINPVNDAPIANDDTVSTDEDTSVNIPVLDNDTDVDGDTLTVVATYSGPAHGNLVIEADNTITYTPDADFNGIDSFDYGISDGNGGVDIATVTITVNPVNDAPLANDDAVSTDEDTSVNIPVLDNDTDVDGDILSVSQIITDPSNGIVVIEADNSITYTPAADYNGVDSFVYEVSDGNGGIDTATVTITINPVNDAPIANDDSADTDEDVPVNIAVLDNDSDVDGDTLSVSQIITDPSNGIVVIEADGSITYTPDPFFNSSDSFVYEVSDGNGGFDTATVTISIRAITASLTIVKEVEGSSLPSEIPDFRFNYRGVDVYVLDPDNPSQDVLFQNGQGGFDPIYLSADEDSGDFFHGLPADNEYRITEANPPELWALVDIECVANRGEVRMLNNPNPPQTRAVRLDLQAGDDIVCTFTNGYPRYSIGNFVWHDINGNGIQDDGEPGINVNSPRLALQLLDSNGNVILNRRTSTGNNPGLYEFRFLEDGTYGVRLAPSNFEPGGVFAPGGALEGWQLSPANQGDDALDSDWTAFDDVIPVTINGSDDFTIDLGLFNNSAPVANDDDVSTDEDTAININVLTNDTDADNDTLTVAQITTDPSNGIVGIEADETITYTPDANFNGSDSFVYEINDGNGGFDTATVTITINAVNDAPIANDDNATTDEDTLININVLANDTDDDGDTLSVSQIISDPSNGIVGIEADNTITYTPDADYNGADSFDYEISDGNGGFDTATVTITINAVNDAPVANDDSATTDEDISVTVDVLDNDTDVDGDSLSVTQIITDPAHGSVLIGPDDTITYTPDANYNGSDSFVYEISDGNGGFDTATVTITINAVNDLPTANNDSFTIDEDAPQTTFNVLPNDIDVDGDAITLLVSDVSNGVLVPNHDGTFLYTPDPDFNGTDSFTYVLRDPGFPGAGLGQDTAVVTITVNPVNDAPVAVDDSAQTDNQTAVNIDVLLNDSDADNDTLTVSQVIQPNNGSVVIEADNSITYTPNGNFIGDDTFTYTVSDGNGGTDTATVTVTVTDSCAGAFPANVDTTTELNDAITCYNQLAVAGVYTINIVGDITLNATTVQINNATDGVELVIEGDSDANDTDSQISGNNTYRIFEILFDTNVSIQNLTLAQGFTSGNGGAIFNSGELILSESTFTNNSARSFAGAINANSGELTINNSTFEGNSAVNGGAIFINNGITGNINDSTFSTNRANASGGAIFTAGLLTISNSTFAENSAIERAGALFNGGGTMNVISSTLSANTAGIAGGAIENRAVTNITNSILANSPNGGDCENLAGTTSFVGINLVEDGSCNTAANPNVLNVDPQLDPNGLQNNGGLTETIALTSSSPAANAGVNDFVDGTVGNALPFDQRGTGFDRIFGGTVDLGAFESDILPNTAPVANDDSAQTDNQTAVNIDVLLNDSDADNDTLTVSQVIQPDNGSVVIEADNSITYTPDNNFLGDDTFTYTIVDGNGGTDTATVTVNVFTAGPGSITVISESTPEDGTNFTFNTTLPVPSGAIYARTVGIGSFTEGAFSYPADVAVASNGNIYVIDSNQDKVQVFDSNYNLLFAFGSIGYGNGQFITPYAIAVDANNNVYVLDYSRDDVQVFDSSGTFLFKFGSTGIGNGQFYYPFDIVVGSNGNIYVTDNRRDDVQVFDSSGTFLFTFGSTGNGDGQFINPYAIAVDASGNVYVSDVSRRDVQVFDSNGNFLFKFGSSGGGDGQFINPYAITVDASGNVYVSDVTRRDVQVFDSNGNFLFKFGSPGGDNGQFYNPWGIDVDANGNIYVADTTHRNVYIFDASGNFLTSLVSEILILDSRGVAIDSNGNTYVVDVLRDVVQVYDSSGDFLFKFGSTGNGNGQFISPFAIAVDASGNVYVSDVNRRDVQVFDSSGNFLFKFGSAGNGDGQFIAPYGIAVDASGNVYVSDVNRRDVQVFNSNGNFLFKFGSTGNGDGQFQQPRGITVDANNNIYVVDHARDDVQVFDSNGNFLFKFGSYGNGDGQFYDPWGITVDANDNIYVVDRSRYDVQVFDSSGTFLFKFGSNGNSDGQFIAPWYIAVDDDGNVYVSDYGRDDVQVFSISTGTASFTLDDANPDDGDAIFQTRTFSLLEAGIYDIQEVIPAGWTLTDVTCVSSGGSVFTDIQDGVSIDLTPGDDVTCTFTNTQE